MAVSISLSISQNSQSITNNTSNVTVKCTLKWTGGSHNAVVNANGTPQANGWVKINGTQYNFASTFNTGKTSSGSQTIFSKTLNITHNDNGDKTLSCSASFNTYVGSGTVTASASKVLTTIPRKSTLSVGNGTLGTAQILTVTRKSSSFTHTITYTCGGTSGTIVSKSSNTSISFTPPITLASQNTAGTTVSIRYDITTFNGSTSIGKNSYTKTCTIPSSIVPSISAFTLTEAVDGLATQFGVFVKNQSKISYNVTASGSYSSTIKSYSVSIAGQQLTSKSGTTAILSVNAGTYTATVKVTDSRGRTATKNVSFTVHDYYAPYFTIVPTVNRCLFDGTLDDEGEYYSLTLGVKIAPVNNKNTVKFGLSFKKSLDKDYTTIGDIVDHLSTISKENGYTYDGTVVIDNYTLSADNSYNIRFQVSDYFGTITKNLILSSARPILDIMGDGSGIALNKVAELSGVCDIGFKVKHSGGKVNLVAEKVSDLNDLVLPNVYVSVNMGTSSYANAPVGLSGTFTIEVMSAGAEGQLMQRITSCNKITPTTYIRHYYQGSWGEWLRDNECILYDNPSGSNGTITLSQNCGSFKYIEIFYTDNNGKVGGSLKVYSPNGKTTTLCAVEAGSGVTTYFRRTLYTISGNTITPNIESAGYVRISTATPSHTSGTNYIKITRVVGRG